MEEKSREQELSVREISLIRELAQIRKEHKRELEYEKFDGYELPPRTQFSMLNKPAVSIKYGVMKFNMACIRLFEGIKYVLPILHPNKKRLALIMCPEEDSASVEWARQKGENWVNKDITSLEFVENIFRLMNWNRECRYKVLGRVANSDQGLCMLFDLEEAIMFTPKPQCRMMINGIQFIQVLLEANGLAAGKDHQFKGRYDAEKNAVIISLRQYGLLSRHFCTQICSEKLLDGGV